MLTQEDIDNLLTKVDGNMQKRKAAIDHVTIQLTNNMQLNLKTLVNSLQSSIQVLSAETQFFYLVEEELAKFLQDSDVERLNNLRQLLGLLTTFRKRIVEQAEKETLAAAAAAKAGTTN